MAELFDLVLEVQFSRVHKSFAVTIKHIHTVEIHQVSLGKYKIPVGNSYREELMKKLN